MGISEEDITPTYHIDPSLDRTSDFLQQCGTKKRKIPVSAHPAREQELKAQGKAPS